MFPQRMDLRDFSVQNSSRRFEDLSNVFPNNILPTERVGNFLGDLPGLARVSAGGSSPGFEMNGLACSRSSCSLVSSLIIGRESISVHALNIQLPLSSALVILESGQKMVFGAIGANFGLAVTGFVSY